MYRWCQFVLDTIAPVIFARGGSKGIPHKNLSLLQGKTLLRWSIEQALGVGFSEVFVSTDSREIAHEAVSAGATVPFLRPAKLADDASPEWLSWQHFCSFLESEHPGLFSHLLVLPATAPLRAEEDVVSVINLISAGGCDVVITMTPAHRHPMFNMVRRDAEGRVELFDTSVSAVSRRQDGEPVFDLTTVAYAASIDFVLSADNMWQGRIAGVVVPQERAVDIDTPFDLELADFLLGRRMSDGS